MNKQWIVIVTDKRGHVAIVGIDGPRLVEHSRVFHSEDAAEQFAAACRDSIENLYSAQVVNVDYCDPNDIEIK